MAEMTDIDPDDILRTLDERFIRYALSLPADVPLSEALRQSTHTGAVALMSSVCKVSRTLSNDDFGSSLSLAHDFGRYHVELGGSLIRHIRSMCGAEIEPVPDRGDQFTQLLSNIAADLWPVLLLRAPSSGPRAFWMSTTLDVYSHPLMTDAARAFMSDLTLSPLFPDAPEIKLGASTAKEVLGIQGVWYTSTGQAASRQLVQVLGGMIFHACLEAQLANGVLDHSGVMNAVPDVVAAFRALADGQIVEIPALVGFSGLKVTSAESVRFSDGELRSMRPIERDLLVGEADRVSSIFSTYFPLRIVKVAAASDMREDDSFPDWRRLEARLQEGHRDLQRRIERVRLGLLLASPGTDKLLATSQVSIYLLDPTNQGGSTSWDTDVRAPGSIDLSEDLASKAVQWHRLLVARHPESLDIAMKRILSAVSQRWDAVDAFIDAVVVWENAFGTQQETTFRVTATIAKLLEPGSTIERARLQTELKKLYNSRSLLVHGSKEPEPHEAWRQRDRAIAIALDVLRTLYNERSDLLSLSSDARGTRVLLEG